MRAVKKKKEKRKQSVKPTLNFVESLAFKLD